MAIPPYFTTTTLRTLLAESDGASADMVREAANTAHIELIVGKDDDAGPGGRVFVELAARTFGSLGIQSPDGELRRALQRLATDTNPAIASSPRRGQRTISVALCADAQSVDVAFWGRGWWAGRRDPGAADPNAVRLGPLLAGALAFNEAFRLAFAAVLPGGSAVASPGWSLRDWSARAADSEDLTARGSGRLPHTALVGCGAIGQALTFCLREALSVGGPIDLIDPQTISETNLQRYVGSRPGDVTNSRHKVSIAAAALAKTGLRAQQHVMDWSTFLRNGHDAPPLVVTALDTASDRRLVQASLPLRIVNGWTRTSDCGSTVHDFDREEQCLVCTYVRVAEAQPVNDFTQLVRELGIDGIRVVQLLSGSSLLPSDLATVERHRRVATGSLVRWRGESVRSLYGELCGALNIQADLRHDYVVPFPQVSFVAGVLVASHLIKIELGHAISRRPIEVSMLSGPGPIWEMPPARKNQHPLRCICKDADYLDAFKTKWSARQSE